MGNNSCDFDDCFQPIVAIANRKEFNLIVPYSILEVYPDLKYCLGNVPAVVVVNAKRCDKTWYGKA